MPVLVFISQLRTFSFLIKVVSYKKKLVARSLSSKKITKKHKIKNNIKGAQWVKSLDPNSYPCTYFPFATIKAGTKENKTAQNRAPIAPIRNRNIFGFMIATKVGGIVTKRIIKVLFDVVSSHSRAS